LPVGVPTVLRPPLPRASSPNRQHQPPPRLIGDPPVTYFVPGETTSPKFALAFSRGCHGQQAPAPSPLQPGPFAAFCTPPIWPLLRQAQAAGRTWFYGDHAFYRRGKFYRVTRNAYQYQPTPATVQHATPARFAQYHVDLQPVWQRTGTAIVVCPNSPAYMREHGIDARQWVIDIVTRLARLTDRPIIVRWKAHAAARPLYVDLHDAWMVVVYNSNCAVDALVAGVPICVLCPWAATVSMGVNDLALVEQPVYPDHRIPFLWALATRQWSLSEIAAGIAWRALQED